MEVRATNELKHHGIKGMKWGVRRFQNKDGTLTPAGRKRYDSSNPYNNTKAQLEEIAYIQDIDDFLNSVNVFNFKRKYNERKDIFDLNNISYNRETVNNLLRADRNKKMSDFVKGLKRVDETGFPMKFLKNSSIEEDAKRVNPTHTDLSISSKNNCTLSTVAYDLRRRGYDVTARKGEIQLLYNVGEKDVLRWYPGSSVKTFKIKNNYDELYNRAFSNIAKQPNGARGNIMISWNGRSGHSVAYEIMDNKVVLVDAQSGKIYKNPRELFSDGVSIQYIRTDNVTPDWDKIKQAVE